MATKGSLPRETIMKRLAEGLQPIDFIHAFWEGGAAAYRRLDDWSDIDAYVMVDDGKVEEAFSAIEEVLRATSGIKQKYGVGGTQWPGLFQAFYKLENASEFLLIDLVVITQSASERLLEPEIHGEAVFYFNKLGSVVVPRLDKKAIEERVRNRIKRLKDRNEMFNIFVQKEINRGNWIEEVDLYKAVVLDSLVEALRMEHYPLHYDFKTRYVHRELPQGVVRRLMELYFVRDEEDLQKKYAEASEWFRGTISNTERRGFHI